MHKIHNLRWHLVLLLLFSLVGFIDATYLTANYFLGQTVKCGVFTGCQEVTGSVYSSLLGVPIALLGAMYYVSIFLLTILAWDTQNLRIIRGISKLTWVGFLTSLYLVGLQLFVIQKICIYCMISATSSTALWIVGMMMLLKNKRGHTLSVL